MKTRLGMFGLVLALAACSSSSPTPATTTPAASGQGASGGEASSDSAVTFRNASRYAIHHIYLSPTSQNTWGSDQLGEHILQPGGDFTLHGIPCNSYDLKLVDQDRDECILHNVNICAEDSGWRIDNDELLSCQGFTAATGSAN